MKTAELIKFIKNTSQPTSEEGEIIIIENGKVIDTIKFFKFFAYPGGNTIKDAVKKCKELGVEEFYIDFNRFYTEFIEKLGIKPKHKRLDNYILN